MKELEALDELCEQIDKIGAIAIKNALMPIEIAKDIDTIFGNIKQLKKGLERKEKLEKAIQLFHDKCDFVYNPKKKMWEFTDMEYFDEDEHKVLDEVFGK